MKSRWSGAVLGVGLLVVLFGGGGTAVAASPWSAAPPGWGYPDRVPALTWRPVDFVQPRPVPTFPAPHGMADYRWRPLADARAAALRRFAAAGWPPAIRAPYPAARLPVAPAWGSGPAGGMAPPRLASGWPAPPRYAAHPAGAWRVAGRPVVVTVGGQPYRFRPLPPSHGQVAAFAPPTWGAAAPPIRPPVAWAQIRPPARYAQSALRPAAAPGHARWVVYRFRPDTRFPSGETLQLPAGARLSHAASGPAWQAGEPVPQAGNEWRSDTVYN